MHVLVGLIVLAAAQDAVQNDAQGNLVDLHDRVDADCDRLFGSRDLRELHRQTRERRLRVVRQGPAYIDIVQTGGWGTPRQLDIRGLEILEVTTADDGERVAVVQVDDALGFCEPGVYEVEVDDALGASGRILALLDDIVLVEHDGALRWIRATAGRVRPVFKVSWQSRFSVISSAGGKTGGVSSKARARKRARRRR